MEAQSSSFMLFGRHTGIWVPSANWTMSFLDILTITSNRFCCGWGPHTARVLVSYRAANVVLEPSQKGHDRSIAQGAAMWVWGGGTPPPNNTDRKLPEKKGKQLFLVKKSRACRLGRNPLFVQQCYPALQPGLWYLSSDSHL